MQVVLDADIYEEEDCVPNAFGLYLADNLSHDDALFLLEKVPLCVREIVYSLFRPSVVTTISIEPQHTQTNTNTGRGPPPPPQRRRRRHRRRRRQRDDAQGAFAAARRPPRRGFGNE